jgi:uncharacterized protein (DUF4415 family)
MSAKSNDLKSTWVDNDDAHELDDSFFARADLSKGGKTVRRGRPVSSNPKTRITIRCSPEVVEAFRATGNGWQTRMDEALKDWLKKHKPDGMEI